MSFNNQNTNQLPSGIPANVPPGMLQQYLQLQQRQQGQQPQMQQQQHMPIQQQQPQQHHPQNIQPQLQQVGLMGMGNNNVTSAGFNNPGTPMSSMMMGGPQGIQSQAPQGMPSQQPAILQQQIQQTLQKYLSNPQQAANLPPHILQQLQAQQEQLRQLQQQQQYQQHQPPQHQPQQNQQQHQHQHQQHPQQTHQQSVQAPPQQALHSQPAVVAEHVPPSPMQAYSPMSPNVANVMPGQAGQYPPNAMGVPNTLSAGGSPQISSSLINSPNHIPAHLRQRQSLSLGRKPMLSSNAIGNIPISNKANSISAGHPGPQVKRTSTSHGFGPRLMVGSPAVIGAPGSKSINDVYAPLANINLPQTTPFYWSKKIKEENEKLDKQEREQGNDKKPKKKRKTISTDVLLYEQITHRDAENDKLLTKEKLQPQSIELMNRLSTSIKFYNDVKMNRMLSIRLAVENKITTNTKNIWGDGYQGYGNSFTNGPTKIIYPKERKKPTRFNDLYFTRDDLLNQSRAKEELVPIRLEFDVEKDKFRLRDSFTWNRNESLVTLEYFVAQTMNDYRFSNPIFSDTVLAAVKEQINDYGSFPVPELKDYFKVPIGSIDDDSNNDVRIMIKLDVTISNHRLIDHFEWDILNKDNNPEEFAEVMCAELQLPGEFVTAIAHSIREQCQLYYKALYLVGYNFDGSKVSEDEVKQHLLPEVNSSTWLRANDQSLEDDTLAPGTNPLAKLAPFTPVVYELNYFDLEKLDKDRERELRRKRRNNGRSFNRRGIPNLPELTDVPKTFRTPIPSTVLPGGVDLGPSAEGYDEFIEEQREPFLRLVKPEDTKPEHDELDIANVADSINQAQQRQSLNSSNFSRSSANNKVRYIHEPGSKLLVIIKV